MQSGDNVWVGPVIGRQNMLCGAEELMDLVISLFGNMVCLD
jgi:hypothetical protein